MNQHPSHDTIILWYTLLFSTALLTIPCSVAIINYTSLIEHHKTALHHKEEFDQIIHSIFLSPIIDCIGINIFFR